MDRTSIIALFLTLLVWVLWLYFYAPKYEKQNTQPTSKSQKIQKKQTTKKVIASKISFLDENTIEKNTFIKKGNYEVEFSSVGGRIKSFRYHYKNTREMNIELVKNTMNFRIIGTLKELYSHNFHKWKLEKATNDEVVFSIKANINGEEVLIKKRYKFISDKDYFRIEFSIKNLSDEAVNLGKLFVSLGDGIGPVLRDKVDIHNPLNKEEVIVIDSDGDDDSYTTTDGIATTKTSLKAIGVSSRFFLLAMYSDNNVDLGKGYIYATSEIKRVAIEKEIGELDSLREISFGYNVYLGLKDEKQIEAVNPMLAEVVRGFLHSLIGPVEKAVEFLLVVSYRYLIANYGVGIIIITILFKLVFHPLSLKSMKSMKKMRDLSPEIQKIREMYKDDPQEMNRQVMALYREHKVNPFGGCLPILLQVPVFFGLYRVLANSIVLWKERFLWVRDLSAPDTLFFFNIGFGHEFAFNLMPIVMTLTSVFQQKISGSFSDPNQKKMAIFMTLLFLFIFWNLPAGLVLYWTVYNLLSALEQAIINKQIEGEKAREKRNRKKRKTRI